MTPEKQKTTRQITSLLMQQENALKEMLETMRQEYQALENNDQAGFDRLVEQKASQVQSLEELEARFKPLITMMGGTLSRDFIESFIDAIDNVPDKQQLQSTWEKFLQVLNDCDEQNRINNRIVESSKSNIQQALNIIRGDDGIPKLYSASGRENTDNQGQSLAIA